MLSIIMLRAQYKMDLPLVELQNFLRALEMLRVEETNPEAGRQRVAVLMQAVEM